MLIFKTSSFLSETDRKRLEEKFQSYTDEKVMLLLPDVDLCTGTVLYLCNRRRCMECHPDECEHTTDIRFAKNFKWAGNAYYEEEEP